MKKNIVAMVIVLIALVWAVPVLGDANVTEKGVGIFLSLGSERDATEYQVVLTDAQTGQILAPQGRVIMIPEGHGIHAQIFPNQAAESKRFEFKWTTLTLTNQNNLRSTSFDPTFGWIFDLDPIDYAQGPLDSRCLSIWTRAFGAKKDFLRAIFKITYNKSSVFQTAQFIIKTVKEEEQTSVNSQSISDLADRLDALETKVDMNDKKADINNSNLQKTVDKVNQHDKEIYGSIVPWMEEASQQQSGTAMSADLPCVIRMTGKNLGSVKLITQDSSKYIRTFTVSYGDSIINLPAGSYQFIISSNGKRSAPKNFEVTAGMKPVKINIY